MLQLVLGIAGSGKTTHLLKEIKQHAALGLPSILLVPEQFSSSAEMLSFRTLGDEYIGLLEVLSFRTLSERIFKTCGWPSGTLLSDAGRVVFVRRALDSLGEVLHSFSRHRRNAAFCQMCADTIGELKTAGALPSKLRDIAAAEGEPKFSEISLIYEAYEAAISTTALDPEDRLSLAAQKADCGYLHGKACFIDNFDGFTSPEHSMLRQLISYCESVAVCLCCDGLLEIDDGLGLFSPVRRTANRLIRSANKAGKQVLAPLQLHVSQRAHTPALHALNALLSFNDAPEKPVPNAGIYYTQNTNANEEVRFAATEMRRLALEGVPFSHMALVCRDISSYESTVRRELSLFNIPFFTDAPSNIEYTAAVAFIRAALALLRGGLASTALLSLLKTRLCGHSEAAVSAFENYVFTWNPKAADLRKPFENNPAGLLANLSNAAQEQLAIAEQLRSSLVPIAEEFIQKAKGASADKLCQRLYLLLERFDAPKHAVLHADTLEKTGEIALAENSRRAWDLAMDLLDQTAALLNGEVLSPAEFDELFLLLVRSTDFGTAPQSLECVTFTTADRMRLASPDYCFILGLNEGEFPMQIGYSGLFTHADRDLLVAAGVELPGSFENRSLLEEMFFYKALISPRLGLYLSRPALRGSTAKGMASKLEPILAAFSPPPLSPNTPQLCATPAAAFHLLSQNYHKDSPKTTAIYGALQNSGLASAQNSLTLLQRVENTGSCKLANLNGLKTLVGEKIVLSATKAEHYHGCRFAYFMERVLGIRQRRRAEFSHMESGTFVHYVLEKVLLETGTRFGECTNETLAEISARYANEFIAQNLPTPNQRTLHLLFRVKQNITQLLYYMRDSAFQSEFTIDAVELSLSGEASGITPFTVQTPAGHTLQVTGKIDRVDVLKKDGRSYLCIVDYKTGTKTFDLANIYCGLNIQMMIYMNALRKNGEERYPNPAPAGVLYLAADPAPQSSLRGKTLPVYEMDGILLDDPAILRALEPEGEGLFLPLKHKAGKGLRAGQKLANLEKMGQIEKHVEHLLATMADEIYEGNFPAKPMVNKQGSPCAICAYRAACRHEDGRNESLIAAPEHVFETGTKGDHADE